MFVIPYRTTGFPPGISTSGKLPCAWSMLLRAALSLSGSPAFGRGSVGWLSRASLEATWRVAIVGASLRCQRPGDPLVRSVEYDRLDRSEKSAVSFFLGQVATKLFAEHLLGVPVLSRVDVAMENHGLPVAGSRPDFYGVSDVLRGTVGVESKGRSNPCTAKDVAAAKKQARQLHPLVAGGPYRAYSNIAYFQGRTWRVRLDDPPSERTPANVRIDDVVAAYYQQIGDVIEERPREEETFGDVRYTVAHLPEVDVRFGLRSDLYALTRGSRGEELAFLARELLARQVADREVTDDDRPVDWGADGVIVVAGPSWAEEIMRREPLERPYRGRG